MKIQKISCVPVTNSLYGILMSPLFDLQILVLDKLHKYSSILSSPFIHTDELVKQQPKWCSYVISCTYIIKILLHFALHRMQHFPC